MITETDVDNSYRQKNPSWPYPRGGDNTTDRIFLLSYAETREYFPSINDRMCSPTEFAVAGGAYRSDKGNCCWWLRSPGPYQDYAASVFTDGSLGYFNRADCDDFAVRPASWINLESDLS